MLYVPDIPASSTKPSPPEKMSEPLRTLLAARNSDPFGILGPHPIDSPTGRRWVGRAFQPRAMDADLLMEGQTRSLPMHRLPNTGFFEVELPGTRELAPAPSSYRIRFRTEYGE